MIGGDMNGDINGWWYVSSDSIGYGRIFGVCGFWGRNEAVESTILHQRIRKSKTHF